MSFRKVKVAKTSLAITSLATLLGISGLGAVTSGIAVHAAESLPAQCTDEVMDKVTGFDKATPVILVHGFNANPGNTWEDTSYHNGHPVARETINTAKYAKVALNFDYAKHATDWVDRPETGQKLALVIGCIGEKSILNGGPGKVIVVGHSMGGLMARYAYSHTLPWGVKASRYMAKVITAGTPNKGTTLDAAKILIGSTPAALVSGSKQLKALPEYDKDFPVYAIAGNLNTRYIIHDPLRKGKFAVVNKPHGNDAYVSVGSASGGNWTARYGGGNETYTCTRAITIGVGKSFLPNPLFESQMPCHHNNIQKSDEGVKLIVTAIERYTTVLQRESQTYPQPQPTQPPTSGTYSATDNFRNLTWKRDSRLSDPERFGTSDGWSSITYKDPSLGGISSPKEWPGFLRVEYNPAWVSRSSWPDCFADSCRGSSIADMPEEYRTIGSRRAPIAAVFGGNSLAWFYPNEGIIVSDFLNSSAGTRDFTKTAAYQSILTMQWK